MFLGFNFGWLFILFGFLATSGDEMASISLWSWLHSLDREHANDGLVSGVINLFSDFGWAVGPIAAGVLYGLVGPTWTIVIGALPIFIAWVIYQFVARKHRHTHHLIPIDLPHKPHRPRHRT
jgi:predicted MFS family arabinose efflux permease